MSVKWPMKAINFGSNDLKWLNLPVSKGGLLPAENHNT